MNLVTLATILALVLAGACSSTTGHHTGPVHLLHANDRSFTIEWSIDRTAIPASEYFELNVEVLPGAEGRGRIGEELRVDAGMPAHRHGMNVTPTVDRVGQGRWVVRDMLLHMPGEWVITFDITDESGSIHRAQTSVVVE